MCIRGCVNADDLISTDLSFQAAARILSVPKFDALKLMRDLSQNFPSKAR